MEHLKKQIYGNIKVLSPDGNPMFLCGNEKAEWYLSRGLAKIISEDSEKKTIQLTFQPKGVGHANDLDKEFFLSKKEERCVVCGSEEELTKHHCVPYLFRSAWSKTEEGKQVNHTMHDVLLVCIHCHKKYEKEANKKKQEMVKEVMKKYQQDHQEADGFLGAVKNIEVFAKHSIPHSQRKKINKFLSKYLSRPLEEMSKDEIKIEVEKLKEEHNKHKKIAKKNMAENLRQFMKKDSLKNFFIMWRHHFVDTMQPKHLPNGWNLNYWKE